MKTPFKIGQLVIHLKSKDWLKITNGTDAGGVFVPTEAIVIRFAGLDDDGKPMLHFTYVAVNPAEIEPSTGVDHIGALFGMDNKERKHFVFAGRI